MGEWSHGWQFQASRILDIEFKEFDLRPNLTPSGQALLLSQGGIHAAKFLQAPPVNYQAAFEDCHFQCLLRRRLRLEIPFGMSKCPGKHCNHVLDKYGDHLASCMKSGRVKKRAKCLEVTWAQICEEAGGAVVRNAKLRDMKLRIDHRDRRHVEFAVFGLP